MNFATIEKSGGSVRFAFNDFAEQFDASKLTVEKSGSRMYLSPDKSYIHVIFADGEKVEIEAGSFSVFINPTTGNLFQSMEQLFDLLSDYLS